MKEKLVAFCGVVLPPLVILAVKAAKITFHTFWVGFGVWLVVSGIILYAAYGKKKPAIPVTCDEKKPAIPVTCDEKKPAIPKEIIAIIGCAIIAIEIALLFGQEAKWLWRTYPQIAICLPMPFLFSFLLNLGEKGEIKNRWTLFFIVALLAGGIAKVAIRGDIFSPKFFTKNTEKRIVIPASAGWVDTGIIKAGTTLHFYAEGKVLTGDGYSSGPNGWRYEKVGAIVSGAPYMALVGKFVGDKVGTHYFIIGEQRHMQFNGNGKLFVSVNGMPKSKNKGEIRLLITYKAIPDK